MYESGDTRFLRLFPLQSVVLFPGMELPLVVFEPRYLQLTQECTATDEPFGVLLLREGREVGENPVDPHEYGTTAHIMEAEPIGDGRTRVLAVGGMRFRVRTFDRGFPYLAADVEMLKDDSGDMVDPSIVDNVKEDATAFVRKVMALRGGFVQNISFPSDPTLLSYQVAQLFQGNPGAQQRLLEKATFDRLWDELELLKNAMRRLSEREKEEGPGRRFSSN